MYQSLTVHLPPLQVISDLLQTMEDQSNPRVQAHAAAALINFTEDCPKSLLIPYLDSLLQHLHVIMVAKLQEVQFSFLRNHNLVPANVLYLASSEGQDSQARPSSLLPVDPEGHQTGPGAGGDIHRLSG